MMHYPTIQMYINGTWGARGLGQEVLNPADECVLGRLPHATHADLDEALAAAAKGFGLWRSISPAQRAHIILKAASLLRDRVDNISTVMTLEQGKPLSQSRLECLRAAEIIEWDANEGRRLYGRVIPAESGMNHTVLREPIGVVAAFSPWNFPVSSPARKIAGALSAGCAVIIKVSEETPASGMLLVKAFADAGVPAGVLNLVYGDPADISSYLIRSPIVRLLTFTGSIPVGKHLASLAGQYMKPSIMELGGHCPVIICDDVDPKKTAALSVIAKSRNAGQVCVAPTRFFVEDRVYDRFVEHFVQDAKALRLGHGLEVSTQIGPLANHRRLDTMARLVDDAIAKGAKLHMGGHRVGDCGYYYPMTVLTDIPDEAAAMREEAFGPLALIQRVATLEEAISKANNLPFGLAAYGFTNAAAKLDMMINGIECGNFSINHFVASLAETPFGGVKESGYGREGGIEGLHCYSIAKNISHKINI